MTTKIIYNSKLLFIIQSKKTKIDSDLKVEGILSKLIYPYDTKTLHKYSWIGEHKILILRVSGNCVIYRAKFV